MKKTICNITSMIISTVIMLIPIRIHYFNSCILLSTVDSYFHKVTFMLAIDIFYFMSLLLFVLSIVKKDRFSLYKWSCVAFFIVTFCTLYLNPKSSANLLDMKYILMYISDFWTIFLILALLIIYVLIPFVPYLKKPLRSPSKTERLQAQIDELQKQVDELQKRD